MITRPLLAATIEDFDSIKYPVLATQKLDGIRCLKVNGEVLTRKFKPIPNHFIRNTLKSILPDGIDGEIMIRNNLEFNHIQSAVMSFEGEPDFVFYAFDYVKDDLTKPYFERVQDLEEWFKSYNQPLISDNYKKHVFILLPNEIENKNHLTCYEAEMLELGFEGVMIRDPLGKYKCGRSTPKEGILSKIKQFKDAEARVIGFEEKLHNDNPQEKNEFGLSKRSSKKEGMVPADTLGALVVEDLSTKKTFNIGSGMNDELKKEIWTNKDKYLNKLVTYKFQEIGQKDLPRFPVFKGFRSELDR